MDSLVEQMAGFQVAFNDYASDCATSPACPLGTDPAQFVVAITNWSIHWWTSPAEHRILAV